MNTSTVAHILWTQDSPDEFPELTDLTPEQAADTSRYDFCPDCTWSAAPDIPGEPNPLYYHPKGQRP